MIRVAVSLAIAGAFVTTSWTQDKLVDRSNIPSTISPEAQEFLSNAQPPVAAPRTVEEWESLQKSFEEAGKEQSKAVIESLGTRFDEMKMAGVGVHLITPRNLDPKHEDKALIHVHGGGYCLYTAESTRFVCATVADLTELRVYCVDYRLAPQHPFPAGLDDCVNAYKAIIEEKSPKRLGLFGISAGGSMVPAMTLRMQAEGLRTPDAIASITPWADLTLSGDTYSTNDELDPVLDRDGLVRTATAYAGQTDTKNPFVSPLFAEYSKGFPTTLIQTGTRDLFLSDCARLHRRMKDSGVDVQLSVFEGMWHGFHVIPNTRFPEARAGFEEVADFLNQRAKRKSVR